MPNCKVGKSRPCGKACIPLKRKGKDIICRIDPITGARLPRGKVAKVGCGVRKVPTCKQGISFLCGKTCLPVLRNGKRVNCKSDPSLNKGPIETKAKNREPVKKWMDLAVKARLMANKIPDNPNGVNLQKERLQKMVARALKKAMAVDKTLAACAIDEDGIIGPCANDIAIGFNGRRSKRFKEGVLPEYPDDVTSCQFGVI